uniref:Uncharacterized protein n=1 Tax=Tetradesmus obliquus TaxID=3088 RepID=A0A383WG13_TETOB|eukprot:jgi/Sobl393_1/7269/SZX76475.1
MIPQATSTASSNWQGGSKANVACHHAPQLRSLGNSRSITRQQRVQPCHARRARSSGSRLQEGQAGIPYQQLQQAQPVPQPQQVEPAAGIPPPSNMQATVTLVPKKDASAALLRQQIPASTDADPLGKFLIKCKLAWNLFFPPQNEAPAAAAATPNLSPKELGKQRLQMILVADRCGLSPSSLVEMKRNTLAALADCMELEDLQDAHLRFTMTREGGTTYSMAVPILRPGPYTEEGDVVGQNRPPSSTGAGAAMAAAAAAAGAFYEAAEDAEEDYDDYEDDAIYDGEFVAVDDAAAAAAAAAAPVGAVPDSWHRQQQQQPEQEELHLEAAAAELAAAEAAAALELQEQQQQLEEQEELGAFKEQLKELLVEELVQDVEDLALQGDAAVTGSSAAAMLRGKSPTVSAAAAAAKGVVAAEAAMALPDAVAAGEAAAAGVLSEQELREVAEQEVQKLVGQQQGTASSAAADDAKEQQ